MIELRILGAPTLEGNDGQTVRTVLHQPRRLVLLSYLALNASGSFLRRDRLLGLFWPNSPETKARSSLSEALSRLRSSLGSQLIATRGNDEVGLAEGLLWCDATELQRAAEAEEWTKVVDLYRGPLLDGLILDPLQEVDGWLESTRARISRVVLDAAGRLADEAAAEGRDDALALAERALSIDPLDGDSARRVMVLLAQAGHRAAALSVFERFAERLRVEKDVEPGASVLALEESIRRDEVATPATAVAITNPDGVSHIGEARSAEKISDAPLRDRLTRGVGVGRASVALGMLVVLAFAAGVALRPEPRSEVRRYGIAFPDGEELSTAVARPRVALSPDGSRILYVGGGEGAPPTLYLRHWDELRAEPLFGTDRATNPFFSPGGERYGFLRGPPNQAVMVASFDGEAPMPLVDGGVGLAGASWSADGHVYFDGVTGGGTTGLVRVPEGGGPTDMVTTVDTASGEVDHVWPSALPEGRGVLFTILREDGPQSADVAVLDQESGTWRVLVRAIGARYVDPGYLLFLRTSGTLAAVPFDLDRLETTGVARDVADGLSWRLNGATDLAVSASGTLIYMQGPRSGDPSELVWIDRDGLVEYAAPPLKGDVSTLALSPDGSQLAYSRLPATWFDVQDIFIRDLNSGTTSRLTTAEPFQNFRADWFPDGRTVAFLSDRRGELDIYSKRINQSAPATLLVDGDGEILHFDLSADGGRVVYASDGDIFAQDLSSHAPARTVMATTALELMPTLSPDERWLAYTSDATGRREVYVASFPDTDSFQRVISVDGGSGPRWANSGREVFYEMPGGAFAVVSIQADGSAEFNVLDHRTLHLPGERWRFGGGRGYALSADDQRIVTTLADTVLRSDELIVNDGMPELLRRLFAR